MRDVEIAAVTQSNLGIVIQGNARDVLRDYSGDRQSDPRERERGNQRGN